MIAITRGATGAHELYSLAPLKSLITGSKGRIPHVWTNDSTFEHNTYSRCWSQPPTYSNLVKTYIAMGEYHVPLLNILQMTEISNGLL